MRTACSSSCYLHSYNGMPSSVTTIVQAAVQEGANVTYQPGVNDTVWADSPTALADAVAAAAGADVVFLCLGLGIHMEAEGLDRYNLSLPYVQSVLLAAVQQVVPPSKLVLVLVSAGAVDVDVTVAGAVIQAWYGGEEMGHGLMDVVMGRVSPSARLPFTFYTQPYMATVGPLSVRGGGGGRRRRFASLPHPRHLPCQTRQDFNMISNGTGRTYRYYSGPYVRYRFGFGLSYTRFNYTALAISPIQSPTNLSVVVTVNITNTGAVAGKDATQVYVTVPPVEGLVTPFYTLQAVAAPLLAVGETAQLTWTLLAPSFLTTHTDGTRNVTGGAYTIAVSSHLPDDAAGEVVSNAVFSTVTLLPMPAVRHLGWRRRVRGTAQ